MTAPQSTGSPEVAPPPLPPASGAVLPYATPLNSWRGKDLILPDGASIADRCVRCNQPSDGKPVKRQLTWHSPLLFLLILFPGLLIYVIVALIVRRRATVYVGLCRPHRVRRRWMIFIAWMIALGSAAMFFLMGPLEDVIEPGILALAGIVGLIFAGIFGVFVSQQLGYAKRIEGHYVWLRGVNRAYPAHVEQPR